MRLALVTMPCSRAVKMPALTPGLRPKSSALTIKYRFAITDQDPSGFDRLQTKLLRQANSFVQPIVGVLGGRRPVLRPAEPLHGQVKSAIIQRRQEFRRRPVGR